MDKQIFSDVVLPEHIYSRYADFEVEQIVDKKQMMSVIDFTDPFLRIDEMAILNNNSKIENSISIGMGRVYLEDTEGHYNNTIYLAMCGWLMASSASVHVAELIPEYAPQVVEAGRVRPMPGVENNGLIRPAKDGTPFFVETKVLKKKMGLLVCETNISFSNVHYGTIGNLKIFLVPKESIWTAKEVARL